MERIRAMGADYHKASTAVPLDQTILDYLATRTSRGRSGSPTGPGRCAVSWGLVHWGMLAGLAGVAIPVVIHLLNRRRTTVVDWGAMQFLELGRRARLKFQLSELLLLAGRMALLAIVALALARPFWIANQPEARAADGAGGMGFFGGPRRDVVLVIDGSGSMGRKAGQTTPRDQALAWARQLIAKLGAGRLGRRAGRQRPRDAAGRTGQL